MKPIEKPKNLFIRLAYFIAKRQFGKVISPLSTIYARRPGLLGFSLKIERRMKKLSISPELGYLLRSLIAIQRDCGFCIDISRFDLLEKGVSAEKTNAIWDFQHSTCFSPAELAAFDYAFQLVHHPESLPAAREKLALYFSDKEMIDIAWVCAAESYYNVMNKGLGLGSDQLCALKIPQEALQGSFS